LLFTSKNALFHNAKETLLKTISTHEIQSARQALSSLDPLLAKAHAVIPVTDWRTRTRGFDGLARLVLEQQVSVASANAIWNKFESGLGLVSSEHVLDKTIEELKSYGLSTPKVHYIYGIAEAHQKGDIDFNELANLDDAAATARLMTLKGIGRWTAEAYLMWCETRTDIFPAADIALQEAVRILDGAAHRPGTEALYARSKDWIPYRSFAAHLLWGYYGAIKKNIIPMPPGVFPYKKPGKQANTPLINR